MLFCIVGAISPGMVVQAFNPAFRSQRQVDLGVKGQSGLHSYLQGFIVTLYLKKQKQ